MDSDEPTETYFIAEGDGDDISVSGLVTGFVVTEGPLAGSDFF